jgi:hypothetical protein
MYESRDFGAMPILADALQDAGCDNDDVLTHCRDATATHVRGGAGWSIWYSARRDATLDAEVMSWLPHQAPT